MWFLALPPSRQLAPSNRVSGLNQITDEKPATLGLHPAEKLHELYRDAWRNMQTELQIVQDSIEARAARTGHYYPYLEPHALPLSISI
jgi:hypothetical protein